AAPPTENGDGRKFLSPDGKAFIAIYGVFNVYADVSAAVDAAAAGQRITYSLRGSDRFVASGVVDGDRIFYLKSILGCGGQVWITAHLEYPAAQKRAYDAIVTHVANALHFATMPACGGSKPQLAMVPAAPPPEAQIGKPVAEFAASHGAPV